MSHTFGEELKRFALTIDSVDSEICKRFFNLLKRYVENVLRMHFFHFMIDSGKFEGNPVLQVPGTGGVFWSSSGSTNSVRTRSEEGSSSYMAQSTYVYDSGNPIWITANGEMLNNAEQYNDAWSSCNDLPIYFAPDKTDVKTSIVVPLRTTERIFGFMCVESLDDLKASKSGKEELIRVAEAAGTVLRLQNTYEEQHRNTEFALNELDILANEHWPSPLHHPKIFIASANSADNQVMGEILKTVNTFAPHIQVEYWKVLEESGDITQIIRRKIAECRFGVCYFSVRSADSPNKFYDNANVLFEAGMMQALTGTPTGQPTAWIPIRECNSIPESPPFDFAQQNMIFVERFDNGQVNLPKFTADLIARIENITGIRASQ